jgi:predicted RNA-binding protein
MLIITKRFFSLLMMRKKVIHNKEVSPQRVKIGPIKWAKLNCSFDKLFSAWKIGHI